MSQSFTPWLLKCLSRLSMIETPYLQRDLFSRSYIKSAEQKKKNINFEQYPRIHLDGLKIANLRNYLTRFLYQILSSQLKIIVFALRSTKFAKLLTKRCKTFGLTQKLEIYDPHKHQTNPPQQHPLY